MSTENTPQQFKTVAPFDRVLGNLDGRNGVDKTKATTIVAVVDIVGDASTFIVQTYRERFEDKAPQDTVFLQHIDATGGYRIVLPNAVCEAIARQRDALTTKGRKRGASRAVEARRANGEAFGFAAMTPEQRRKARAKAKATRAAKAARKAARRAQR